MSYDASKIDILEGLQPVRKRPGMYIGGTGKSGLHHLVWEIVDNSIDEAINGYANKITVTLHSDQKTISVTDNGRGIPIDIHPKAGVPALQVILTTLHAGGKFDQDNYITSGGLHGVGSSVVNALSEKLIARVRRNGYEWEQTYQRGIPTSELTKVRQFRGTGTWISFTPDPQIFSNVFFDTNLIKQRLEISAFLNKGLKIVFTNEKGNQRDEFQYDGGVSDFLKKETKNETVIGNATFTYTQQDNPRIDVALSWTGSPRERIRSFVNGIPTNEGGTHEQGLKDAILKSIRNFISNHSVPLPRGIKLTADDIREGVVGICSCFIGNPQFQGQTKDKLNNPEIRAQLESAVRPALEQWLTKNQSVTDTLVTRMVMAAKARMASRAANEQVRRKSAVNRKLNLPGKLSDCTSKTAENSELFIVEGDSAGGSAKQGRDRKTQAILPLRGKVLNAEQATMKKVLSNKELSDIVSALGCGIGKDFNVERLRYNKIILLMDADQDGHHITTLLLTFFYRYMKPLIDNGHIFIAQPPLYRVSVGKKDYWASDDKARDKILKKLPNRSNPKISRFKGLGEMMPKTLYKTTLDPKNRKLLQVAIPDGLAMETETVISNLMGKNPKSRYDAIIGWMSVVDSIDI